MDSFCGVGKSIKGHPGLAEITGPTSGEYSSCCSDKNRNIIKKRFNLS